MALNKSNGNMYEFISHTWNPLAGMCPHGCSYCSTDSLKKYPVVKSKYSGEVRLEEKELETNLGSKHFIFVCAQNDLFADGVPTAGIEQILEYCSTFDNEYLFQSKNPKRFAEFVLPKKSVVCTTIETNRWYPEIMNNSPHPEERAEAMEILSKTYPTYVTIEPILDFDLDELVGLIRQCKPVKVNIGADSKGHNLPEPDSDKILRLISELKKFTTIDKKKNLGRLLR